MKSITTIFLLFCLISLNAQDVAQWRGLNRDGIYNETQLMKSWPDKGPELLWFTEEIGNGYGAPTIANNKVYVNGEMDSISHLFAFDLKGKLLWKTPNGDEFTGKGFSGNFPGSRSAPTVIGDLVYICSGNGRIACLDSDKGKEKWALDMFKDFNGKPVKFGISESLLIDGDNLFFYPGGTEANVVKLNRFTGETVWKSEAVKDTAAYCSPMMIKLPKRNIFVTYSSDILFGLDDKDGKLLWTQKLDSVDFGDQCNTPVYADGSIYCLSEGHGASRIDLLEDGAAIKEVWQNIKVVNYFHGFIKINDYLFCPDRKQKLKKVDCKTGQVVDILKVKRGSIIEADDMLYIYSDNGTFYLIKYKEKMEIVSSFKVDKGTKEHFSHPVISNGVLYVRHGKALLAYNIKQ